MTEEEKLRQKIKRLNERMAKVNEERKRAREQIINLKIDLGGPT